MPVCPNCDRENPKGFQYCGYCGASLPGEGDQVRKTVTVLFSDITGSTSLGERLDPESLRTAVSRFFDVARTVMERHGGTVEKFIGDAVMAVFGVPVVHEDDALRAARAAVELREALTELNEELERAWGASLHIRTGINSGEVVAGDPATAQSFVSGDAVNIAARLEQAAEPGDILIGAETLRLVRDALHAEPVAPLHLKGKAEPVQAYRLTGVVPGAPAFARRLDSRMVARDRELRELLDAFDRAQRAEGCELVTVVGVAGVGKSRLVHELTSRLATKARILRGRCLPYGEGITFWPVAEIVRQAAAIEDSDTPERAMTKLGVLLSAQAPEEKALIQDRLAAAVGLDEASGSIQETFWAVRRLLESVASERPLVAIIDDIHWAEPTMLDLIEYIAGFSRGHSILLLCTARPELREARSDWGRTGSTLALQLLDAPASEQLIRNLLGTAHLLRELESRIVQAAEGNPLFVEEMLRMLIDEGLLRRDDGHWTPTGDLSHVSAPRTIQALIGARLDRLHEEERAVIQRASVVGKVFYWGAVVILSAPEVESAVGAHLQALLRKELILPQPSPFAGEDAFRFSHILVRDTAYESMPKRTRAELHERLASWLDQKAASRLAEYEEIIGYHLEQAHRYLEELGPLDDLGRGLAARAAKHLGSGGRRSYRRGDMPAAANLMNRAIDLLSEEASERRGLLLLLGAALTDIGKFELSYDVLTTALEAARKSGDRALEARTITRLAFLGLHAGTFGEREALREIERAIPLAERAGDDAGLAGAWKMRAIVEFWMGRAAEAAADLERSIEYARAAGDERLEVESLWWLGMTMLHGPTPASEGIERLKDVAERFGDDRTLAFHAIRMRSELEALQGRFDLARDLIEEAKSLGRDLGLETYYAGGALRHSGYIAMLAGDPETAARELVEAVEILGRIGDRGHLASVAPEYGEVLHLFGRHEEAEHWMEVAKECTTEGDVDARVQWGRVQAKALARRGRFDDAIALAREAVRVSEPTDFLDLRGRALMDLAEVLRLANRAEEAVPVLREAIGVFRRKGNLVMTERAAAIVEELASST